MKELVDPLLETYCKYKKVTLENVYSNTRFRVSKKEFLIADITIENNKVTLCYVNNMETYSVDEFIKYLEKEIEQMKFIKRTSNRYYKTFPLQHVKMKFVEHGDEWCKEYGRRQNIRFLGIKK